MLFSSFAKCSSLREVSGAMLGLAGKAKHFQLNHIPRRSTLSDANKRREADVFGEIYNKLLLQYGHHISDSRIKQVIKKQLKIIDSSTISLFKGILKCVGRNPHNGKKKGGIKVHTVINVDEYVPKMVWFSAAATHDHMLLEKLKLDEHTIYIFDKGYNDYKAFEKMTQAQTGFVTRIKDNAVYNVVSKQTIAEHIHSGVEKDEIIEIQVKNNNISQSLRLRKVQFYDRNLKRRFEFLTNLFDIRTDLIAAFYKVRWQIELLFKQLKQNFPLKYFLGDNENAIKIQIYCALIANLLMTVIQKTVKHMSCGGFIDTYLHILTLFNLLIIFHLLHFIRHKPYALLVAFNFLTKFELIVLNLSI